MSDPVDPTTLSDQDLLSQYIAMNKLRQTAVAAKDQATLDSTKVQYSALVAEKLRRARRP